MKYHFFILFFLIALAVSLSCSSSKKQVPSLVEVDCEEIIRLLPAMISNNGEGQISYDVELVAYMKSVWPCLEGKPKDAVIGLFGKPAGNNQGEDPTFVSFNFSYDSKVRCHNPRKTCITLHFIVDTTDLTVYTYRIMAFN